MDTTINWSFLVFFDKLRAENSSSFHGDVPHCSLFDRSMLTQPLTEIAVFIE